MFNKSYGTKINGQLHFVHTKIDLSGNNPPTHRYYIDDKLVDQEQTSSNKFDLGYEDFLIKVDLSKKLYQLEHTSGKSFPLRPLQKNIIKEELEKKGLHNIDVNPSKKVVEMKKFKIQDVVPAAIVTAITALIYYFLGNSSNNILPIISGIALAIGPFMLFSVLEEKFMLFKILGSYSLIAAGVIAFLMAEAILPSGGSSSSSSSVSNAELYQQLDGNGSALSREVIISDIQYQNPRTYEDGATETGFYKQIYTFNLAAGTYQGFHKSEQPEFFLGDTIWIYYLGSNPAINQSTKNVNNKEFLR